MILKCIRKQVCTNNDDNEDDGKMALASNRKDQINDIIPQVMAIHFNSHSPTMQ